MLPLFAGVGSSVRRGLLVLLVAVISVVGGLGVASAASGRRVVGRVRVPGLVVGNRGRVVVGLVARARVRAGRVRRVGGGFWSGRVGLWFWGRGGSSAGGVGGSVVARVRASALRDPVVSVGKVPTGVAVSASTAYVANEGSNSVSVIDLTQSPPVVAATIPVGAEPDAVALSRGWFSVVRVEFQGWDAEHHRYGDEYGLAYGDGG